MRPLGRPGVEEILPLPVEPRVDRQASTGLHHCSAPMASGPRALSRLTLWKGSPWGKGGQSHLPGTREGSGAADYPTRPGRLGDLLQWPVTEGAFRVCLWVSSWARVNLRGSSARERVRRRGKSGMPRGVWEKVGRSGTLGGRAGGTLPVGWFPASLRGLGLPRRRTLALFAAVFVETLSVG